MPLPRQGPLGRYRAALLGLLSLITVAGVIFGAFLVFLLYEWLIDPLGLYGIGLSNTSSVIFMGVMYLLALGIYLGFKAYRRREGIDIRKVYQEIPVE